MSEKVETVRRFVDAFNRLDIDSVAELLDPDVRLDEWPEAPGAQSYWGIDGVRKALDTWFETWEWMKVEIEQIVDLDDRVLFTLHQRAKGRGSEIELEMRSYNVYSFQDGKVIRLQLFIDREDALEAAGLTKKAPAPAGNAAIVRRLMDAFDRDDFEAQLAILDPEVELVEWPNSPDPKTFRGHEGALRARESWSEAWEWLRTEVEEIVEVEDRVLVCGHTVGKGKGSAIEVGVGAFNVYTLRVGRVTRIEFFTEREPGLRAAGLSQATNSEEAA